MRHLYPFSKFFSNDVPNTVKEIIQKAAIPFMHCIYLFDEPEENNLETKPIDTEVEASKSNLTEILNALSKHCSFKDIARLKAWLEVNSVVKSEDAAEKATSTMSSNLNT